MPIYEYKCECGKIYEIIISCNSSSVIEDEIKCGCGKMAKRIISRTSFQLTGNGFYATDYKDK